MVGDEEERRRGSGPSGDGAPVTGRRGRGAPGVRTTTAKAEVRSAGSGEDRSGGDRLPESDEGSKREGARGGATVLGKGGEERWQMVREKTEPREAIYRGGGGHNHGFARRRWRPGKGRRGKGRKGGRGRKEGRGEFGNSITASKTGERWKGKAGCGRIRPAGARKERGEGKKGKRWRGRKTVLTGGAGRQRKKGVAADGRGPRGSERKGGRERAAGIGLGGDVGGSEPSTCRPEGELGFLILEFGFDFQKSLGN